MICLWKDDRPLDDHLWRRMWARRSNDRRHPGTISTYTTSDMAGSGILCLSLDLEQTLPSVANGVVRAPRQYLGYFVPLMSEGLDGVHDERILGSSPGLLFFGATIGTLVVLRNCGAPPAERRPRPCLCADATTIAALLIARVGRR
eukprot:scaffold241701_cov30-Tisochrysis_lutea.AAC.3